MNSTTLVCDVRRVTMYDPPSPPSLLGPTWSNVTNVNITLPGMKLENTTGTGADDGDALVYSRSDYRAYTVETALPQEWENPGDVELVWDGIPLDSPWAAPRCTLDKIEAAQPVVRGNGSRSSVSRLVLKQPCGWNLVDN